MQVNSHFAGFAVKYRKILYIYILMSVRMFARAYVSDFVYLREDNHNNNRWCLPSHIENVLLFFVHIYEVFSVTVNHYCARSKALNYIWRKSGHLDCNPFGIRLT